MSTPGPVHCVQRLCADLQNTATAISFAFGLFCMIYAALRHRLIKDSRKARLINMLFMVLFAIAFLSMLAAFLMPYILGIFFGAPGPLDCDVANCPSYSI